MDRLNEFLRSYPSRSFSKGQVILVEDEVPTAAHIIKKGVVKTYSLTTDGQEKPIAYDIKGEVFPIGWVFRKLRRTQYYYEAFSDCEVYLVPRDEYISFLRANKDVLFWAFDFFVKRFLNYQMRINALEQSKAADKVLNTIHYLCLRFGQEINKDTVKIQLPFTHQDLANFMGLTRETTGIELKKLEKAGIIKYRRQNYVVKTNKLNELLDEDYESGMVIESSPNKKDG